MKLTLEDTEEFLTLPVDAIVPVRVEEIVLRDVPGTNGKQGWQKLNFRFKILDVPDNLREKYGVLVDGTIFGSVGARFTMHPDNKLRQWAEALLGMELDAGFELDTDVLVNRTARAVIKQYTKKDSTQTNHEVGGLLPSVPGGSTFSPTPAVSTAGIFGDDEPPF